jgi:hypothetical protein
MRFLKFGEPSCGERLITGFFFKQVKGFVEAEGFSVEIVYR